MNREEARQLLPIIRAFAKGKTVQCQPSLIAPWDDLGDAVNFLYGPNCYRIKPEPKLRPWTSNEMPRVLVVRCKAGPGRPVSLIVDGEWEHGILVSPTDLADNYVRLDENGSEHPCGVVEGEP